MIDLHMHSSLSDGICSVGEISEIAEKMRLSCISITDHNHALAYEDDNLPKLDAFKGHVLTGCEIATSYKGSIIEILGYGIDQHVINSWWRDFYSDENLRRNETMLFNRLKKLCVKENLRLDDNLSLNEISKGCSKKTVYGNLMKFKENADALNINSYHDFFRRMISNPDHPLFLNEAETYPYIADVVSLIHDAGGIAFLAHPFEYRFGDLRTALDGIVDLAPIDGIECFHPSASIQNCGELMNYCRDNALYMSGGSDFHNYRRSSRIGISSGDKPISDETVKPWIERIHLIK